MEIGLSPGVTLLIRIVQLRKERSPQKECWWWLMSQNPEQNSSSVSSASWIFKWSTALVCIVIGSIDYYQCLRLESWYTNLEQTTQKILKLPCNLYLHLMNIYSTENLDYTFVLSQLTTYCEHHLQTGEQCSNHYSPSSLIIALALFLLPITIYTSASIHSFEFPTITWIWT